MSKQHASRQKIALFWDWFTAHARTIESLLETSDADRLSKLIDPVVSELADKLGWEVGPGCEKEYAFSFALNGRLENVALAEEIVQSAPELPTWEFRAGRPPKQWDFTFSMSNRKGQNVEIDAREWQYSLIGYDDLSFFDITILAKNAPRMDEAARHQAVMIVLQSIFGERSALEWFGKIRLVTSMPDDGASRFSSITDIADHIAHLRSAQSA